MTFILLFPAYKISERGLLISKEDTRNIAKAWIESNIPAGNKILIDEKGPQLMMDEELLLELLAISEKADSTGLLQHISIHTSSMQKSRLRVPLLINYKKSGFPGGENQKLRQTPII